VRLASIPADCKSNVSPAENNGVSVEKAVESSCKAGWYLLAWRVAEISAGCNINSLETWLWRGWLAHPQEKFCEKSTELGGVAAIAQLKGVSVYNV